MAAATAPPGPVAAGRALAPVRRRVRGNARRLSRRVSRRAELDLQAQGSSTVPAQVKKWSELMALLKSGVLDPVIGSQFSMEETASAIRTIDERRSAGMVLVRIG